ncbi:MAG: hypothetical protein WCO00_06975 [Rhodospirillaceae bacterium]
MVRSFCWAGRQTGRRGVVAAMVVAAGLGTGLGLDCGRARAQPAAVSSEAASRLTDTLDIALRQHLPSQGAKGGWHWSGRPLVVPAGDHFEVDLPALALGDDDGSAIQVGVIKLTLAPEPAGSWQVGLTLPGQILMMAADGRPDGEITIASQRLTGRWLPALMTFITLDASLGGLRAASKKDKTRLEVATLALRTDLAELPPGRWSGPGSLAVSGLTMVDEHGVEVARVGSAGIDSAVTGLDLARLVKIGGTDAVGHHPELWRSLLSGVTARLTALDTTMTAGNDGSSFTVKEVSAHGGVEGLDGEHSSITLGYRHGGLSLTPSPGPREFTPEKAELDLAVFSLPNTGLWSAVEAVLKPAPGLTEDQIGTQFSQAVMTAFTQAGSRLVVKALSLDTPAAAARIKGDATFDGKAAFGLVAGIDMVLRGLDTTVKEMQPAPGAKPDEEAQKTLATLALVQAMGAAGKDEAGRDVRSYKFDLGPDGRILLNGADMSVLLQAVQGQGAKP